MADQRRGAGARLSGVLQAPTLHSLAPDVDETEPAAEPRRQGGRSEEGQGGRGQADRANSLHPRRPVRKRIIVQRTDAT